VDAGSDPGPDAVPTAAADDDGWEPGPPSIRAMAPSIVGGAVVPLAVHTIVRHRAGIDTIALVSTAFLGGLFGFTIWYSRLVRARAVPTA